MIYFWSTMFFSKIQYEHKTCWVFLLSGLEHASKENKLIAKRSKDKTSPPTFVDSVLPCLEALGLPTCSKVRHPTLVADGSGGLAHALRMLI